MPIELKHYDIIFGDFGDFKAQTANVFIDINAIPQHRQSSMLFTLSVGDLGSKSADYFTVNVVICPDLGKRKNPWFGKGFLKFSTFDPKEIMEHIESTITACDAGTFQNSLPCLRQKFDWEYEGMSN